MSNLDHCSARGLRHTAEPVPAFRTLTPLTADHSTHTADVTCGAIPVRTDFAVGTNRPARVSLGSLLRSRTRRNRRPTSNWRRLQPPRDPMSLTLPDGLAYKNATLMGLGLISNWCLAAADSENEMRVCFMRNLVAQSRELEFHSRVDYKRESSAIDNLLKRTATLQLLPGNPRSTGQPHASFWRRRTGASKPFTDFQWNRTIYAAC